MQLPCSPCPSVDKKGLRCPPRPSVDKKGLRCPPCPSAALRGQKKGFLRAPSRPFADKKGVLPAPSCPFVDKMVLRCSPCPSAALRGQKVLPLPFSAPLRGQKGVKVFLVAGHCIKLGQTHVRLPESVGAPLVGALRGLLWRPNLDAIALFSLPLRGQEGSKMFSVPLRGPPWTKRV